MSTAQRASGSCLGNGHGAAIDCHTDSIRTVAWWQAATGGAFKVEAADAAASQQQRVSDSWLPYSQNYWAVSRLQKQQSSEKRLHSCFPAHPRLHAVLLPRPVHDEACDGLAGQQRRLSWQHSCGSLQADAHSVTVQRCLCYRQTTNAVKHGCGQRGGGLCASPTQRRALKEWRNAHSARAPPAGALDVHWATHEPHSSRRGSDVAPVIPSC